MKKAEKEFYWFEKKKKKQRISKIIFDNKIEKKI